MKIRLSTRVQKVRPSQTLAITARARELRAAGHDIIGLGAGEPDFDTPGHIKEAAIRAIQEGFTKYTAVDGTPELKQAICAKFERENSLNYTPEQILVSAGGKQSFYNLAQALLDEGDEVIIPSPYWVSYPDMVLLASAMPVSVMTTHHQGFRMTPAQLEAAITDRTRLVVLNSPSNPTGAAYSRAELEALGQVLERHPELIIATDDMYEHILWNGETFCNIVNVCPSLHERTIVLNGVSKAYAMTGWRIGYAGGPGELIAAMKKVQSQSTSNPNSIAQVAAQAALEGDQSCIATMVSAFRERHDFVVDALNRMPGIECQPAQGTFYCFPSLQGLIDQLDGVEDDVALAEHMINTIGLALVPGSAFGAPGYMRLSYATGMDLLEQAMERLKSLTTGI